MVTQNYRELITDVPGQAWPFIGIHGNALEVVIRDLVMQLCHVRIADRQAVTRVRHSYAGDCVGVYYTAYTQDASMNGGIHDKTRRVDWLARLTRCAPHVALWVDLHQIRHTNPSVGQTKRIDRKGRVAIIIHVIFRLQVRRGVVVDKPGLTQLCKDTIARRRLHTRVPFSWATPGRVMDLDVRTGVGRRREHHYNPSPGRRDHAPIRLPAFK